MVLGEAEALTLPAGTTASEASAIGVSVVILAYRPGPRLAETLAALGQSTLPPVEIVVVDNAGHDNATADAVKACTGARIVRAACNDGFGAGMNLGASALQADSEAILFLTHECKLAPSALAEMYASLRSSDSVAAAGPVIARLSQPDRVWSVGGSFTKLLRRPLHLKADQNLAMATPDEDVTVDWLDGAAFLVRRTAFSELGGFREGYFLYWEDIDACHQLQELGWRVLVSCEAVAWQEPSMVSPYLEARNSLMFHRLSNGWRLVALAVLAQLHSLAKLLLAPPAFFRQSVRLGWARAVGLVHGFNGHLDRRLATYR